MNRLIAAALSVVLGGCSNFNQLEADALAAGRRSAMSGGSAGGMSGGSAGGMSGGSAGGMSGGSAGGMSGGSAGGMGGGSAGGMGGGSPGGGGPSGGPGGGGAGPGGGGASGGQGGGGTAGGSAGGSSREREVAAWTGTLEYATANQLVGIAATSSNGLLARAERTDGGVSVVATGPNVVTAAGQFVDLDARFGAAALTTSEGLWLLPPSASWIPVASGPPMGTNLAFSTPLYRPPGEVAQYASYWQLSGTSEVGVFSGPATSLSYGTQAPLVFQASALRVRPDEDGGSGLIVGTRELPDGGSVAFLRRIASSGGLTTGGDVPSVFNLMVATSESQQALLVWRSTPMGGRSGANFWRPSGSNTLPMVPEFRLDSTAGVPPIVAVATDATRCAVVIGPTAGSEWTFDGGANFGGDAGVLISANEYVLVTGGGLAPPRFVTLGPAAREPFGLAFAVRNFDAGIFVMGNCAAAAGFCPAAGGVIGFLGQP